MAVATTRLVSTEVRTRFAPSPTGDLHLGGVRTALFAWLYARHHHGCFILRIEDTDKARHRHTATQAILDGMAWLGLDHDEGPYYQSKRSERYRAAVDRLLSAGNAYPCYCDKERLEALREAAMARGEKPKYDGHCRHRRMNGATAPVIRFKNPTAGCVVVDDRVQGKVVYQNAELDDLIIARADGTPTYHLAVVVDDLDMRITDVIRGDDHLNNTPRQINLLQALDAQPPNYAHLPMLLGDNGRRLSKRDDATNVLHYRAQGYLPEALLNYLVRLGWSHGDQEMFTVDEMINYFDITAVNQAPSTVDPEKLLWLNQQHIKQTSDAILSTRLADYFAKLETPVDEGPPLTELAHIQKERTKTLLEMAEQSLCFYTEFGQYDKKAAKKYLRPVARQALQVLYERLSFVDDWQAENLHRIFSTVTVELNIKLGKIAQPLRVAVTGKAASPPIDLTLQLVGKERTLSRIQCAIEYIDKRDIEEQG